MKLKVGGKMRFKKYTVVKLFCILLGGLFFTSAACCQETINETYPSLNGENISILYGIFKDTVIDPPNPENYKEYSIENADVYLPKIKTLAFDIDQMLSGISYKEDERYGALLRKMRDVLYADAKYLPLAIKNDPSQDIFWYELRSKWLKEIDTIYAEVFPIADQTMARDYVYSLTNIRNWNKNNPPMISIIKGYYVPEKGTSGVKEDLLGSGVISTKTWNKLNLKEANLYREGEHFIIERNVCVLPNLPLQADLTKNNFDKYAEGAKIVRIKETLTPGASYTCEFLEVITEEPPLDEIFHIKS